MTCTHFVFNKKDELSRMISVITSDEGTISNKATLKTFYLLEGQVVTLLDERSHVYGYKYTQGKWSRFNLQD